MENLIFIGDSYIEATGDATHIGWCNRVVTFTQKRFPALALTNTLLGVGGNTSADILHRWQKEVQKALQPHTTTRLIFAFGLNDCARKHADQLAIPLTETLQNSESILTEATKTFPCLMIGPAPVREDRRRLEDVKAVSDGLAALCQRLHIPYLSLIPLLQDNPTWQAILHHYDGLHPNEEGYGLMAEIIANWPAWNAWLMAENSL
ncbi:GDSL-type esterase/lipase family protein [Entomobacter blattae]|uniref:GDSL-like Lipase/Acylhydrolase family protein n=1 Tax=Entomobacter blattae TaxID=2762277 RepID=A0A7H1NQF7_9PROT|nr:GDSL-type esterase/lipase family protein [Entomobacter blattae]QNT78017.1 GDSL-like Lipase/Acylhydrolase family protein [Entomobacter blattae]